MNNKIKNITVLGDGSWGTTLAVHLAKKGYQITLWGAFADNIKAISKSSYNTKFLPGIKLPSNISVTHDLAGAVSSSDLILLAVPSEYLDLILKKVQKLCFQGKTFLSVVKGINTKSLLRMSQVITRRLGQVPLAVLSGPTIAKEVACGLPSTAVIVSQNLRIAQKLQKIFNSETFRIYTNTDLIGVELGGSLKNVIAIACGLCDGLGYGTNTKAAILTRGLVEISRLGKAMGAKTKTFSGLAGLGDLVTTCFSLQSRNRSVGEKLGQGQSIQNITQSMHMVAEGVATVKAVYKLSKKLNVDMPISCEIYKIIYNNKDPQKAVSDLMRRKPKSEHK